ncbi:peptidoglycan editing factor PgeF [Janibacter melonis]|uniref:peptidoglycan editing factor PgeF n=1 Tax=Janibacter melonis TaxID=262209 RepID=UPI00355875A1
MSEHPFAPLPTQHPLRWESRDEGVLRAVTHRLGGVSEGPYDGLNLGGHVGDDPTAVARNRTLVEEAVGTPVAYMDQVHGADVVHVRAAGGSPTCDAMVSDTRGVTLAVLVADCTPVLLHDARAGVVGAAHAGRPGMLAGVVPATVAAMRDLGAEQITATLGPSVCGRCYEVPAAMREDAAATSPASYAMTWQGTPAIDVAAGVVEQLAALDVAVQWLPGCTREDPTLYSYRRDGTTGRLAGLVGLA